MANHCDVTEEFSKHQFGEGMDTQGLVRRRQSKADPSAVVAERFREALRKGRAKFSGARQCESDSRCR